MSYDKIEILFVEDSIDDATLTLRGLKKSGVTNIIFHVKDGAEALDFMYCKGTFASRSSREHIKLILLDLKMPKVSGIEVLQKMKSDPELKSIPIVILTSSKEDSDIERCYKYGANSYIVKPIESDDFFQVIKEIGTYWMLLNQPSH
jgi:CheY-like chemotaxis protein